MLHFIPAWYQDNRFCEIEQNWYSRRMQSEFDDTVKQVQLFQRKTKYPYQILLVSFNPNFRHFLHRQGVYHAPYWSCFDAICEIKRTKVRMLPVHDISWPEGIEFVYTPFVLVAKLNGAKYAEVEYGEDGNPIRISMYENNVIVRKNNYDDRGFIASTIVYENGYPVYEDFLMEKGVRKFRYFYLDGHVEINEKEPNYTFMSRNIEKKYKFSHLLYTSMTDLIQEVLKSYIDEIPSSDAFCLAMSGLQARLMTPLLTSRRLILSFFQTRMSQNEIAMNWEIIGNANYIINDSKENTELISNIFGDKLPPHKDISPYDTRVDFGISQQLGVQNILVPVDELSDELLDRLIVILGKYLGTNKYARIHLFTRSAEYSQESILLDRVRKLYEENNIIEEWVENLNNEDFAKVSFKNENDVDKNEEIRCYVDQCVDEQSVSNCMREQRLIIDLRPVPELYLQIAAISMGIPQIVMKETQFIEDYKNGRVLTSLDRLEGILNYYLDGLSNWNDAMVYAYDLGKRYTTDVLLNAWKEVMDSIG